MVTVRRIPDDGGDVEDDLLNSGTIRPSTAAEQRPMVGCSVEQDQRVRDPRSRVSVPATTRETRTSELRRRELFAVDVYAVARTTRGARGCRRPLLGRQVTRAARFRMRSAAGYGLVRVLADELWIRARTKDVECCANHVEVLVPMPSSRRDLRGSRGITCGRSRTGRRDQLVDDDTAVRCTSSSTLDHLG